MSFLVVLFATCIGLGLASDVKRYELFTATDKTKWIQVSQLEQIFSSIEESLREMNEKQKRDSSVMTQLSSNIQSINFRLQGIEEQLTRIERAETYSKVQLQQFADESIKEEVQIDLISQRLEKNRQQLNQRLNDVDSNLETILKIQDIMEKEIRKINVVQNALTDNVDELSQHTKQQSSKILQNITNTQQELHQKLKFDNKLNTIKSQAQSIETNVLECTEVVNKIYNKLDTKKDDLELFVKDQFNLLLEQMKQQYTRDLNKFEGVFKENFDAIMKEQMNFKDTCHRLQIYEMQMEDKAVEILENLFVHINNKTYEIQHDIENLVVWASKPVENRTMPNLNWSNLNWQSPKIMGKMEEILKTRPTAVNTTQGDSPSTLPVVPVNKIVAAKKLDGTNEQVAKSQYRPPKKSIIQREWLPSERPDKVYLADEPQRLPAEPSERFVQKEQPISVSEKLKAVHRTQPQLVEVKFSPEHFYGIEGLSRSKRSVPPLT